VIPVLGEPTGNNIPFRQTPPDFNTAAQTLPAVNSVCIGSNYPGYRFVRLVGLVIARSSLRSFSVMNSKQTVQKPLISFSNVRNQSPDKAPEIVNLRVYAKQVSWFGLVVV
jgi:hypothetical protein